MSPFTIAHGILGLEGIHRIADEVDMNTQTGLPRVELDRITGIHALPEADDNREANYGRGGERVYPSLNRGRTITYEGRILGRTLFEMRAQTHTLRHAAEHGRLGETSFVVRPHPSVGGVSHSFTARVLAFECDDEQTIGVDSMPTPYQRSFVLTARQGDPRYYLVGGDVAVSGTSGQVRAINNPGNADALPEFIVNPPFASTLVFHRFDNFIERKLVYTDIDTVDQLILNFHDRTFTSADGTSYDQHRVFDDSNWWDAGAAGLNPGVTNITVEGNSGVWWCQFTPASW